MICLSLKSIFKSFNISNILNKNLPIIHYKQQQAAATPLYCACSRDVLQFGGTYWNNCNVCMPNPIAKDEQFSIRLWKLCEQMITKRMGKLETLKEI